MPAKRSYSVEQVKAGVRAYFSLKSFRKASTITNTPRSTIHGWVQRIGSRVQKRRRKLPIARKPSPLWALVSKYVLEHPCTTASTIRRCVAKTISPIPSLSTVYRSMKSAGFTNKDIHWRCSSTAKDPLTKAQFLELANSTGVHNFVSLDEFSAISTDRPRRGWCKRGRKLYIQSRPATRHKVSCIVAIGKEGVLACQVVKGAVNKLSFVEFMTTMLCGGSLRGRTVLMDNVAFHKSVDILQLCADHGAHVAFTPPYSPECNPIENFFSVVKDELRWYLADSGSPPTYEEFEDVVHDTVHAAACRVSMPAFFDGFLERAALVPT